ncbi:hypothetical protein PC129_g18069 [Phytophthora cactorum]|uniref:Reverse transcriptase RNase H-like domain-containing protein n=1 Tax=Phytophthora cactorum TaxID=29920 RepID=A0A8T1JNC1_9STRA|nr:hypothetical protein Pcac1_g24940 [Phytophthora cactorum]KAG2799881.1 hypothetical protein PC111_g20227 [Phytophthora cactorum]KAG2806899.1 hypothetical protein PC112_g17643 [Phytophthora cactorum]KAG2832706.1 hypothetical protein PC113_g20703 [Phytophthora cactorum]KAG2878681.1 hypothetical protein PC114_g22962 [Phytophthora cactorum]
MDYHPAEKEVLALLMMLKAWVTTLAGKRIKVYTRFSTLEWLNKSKTLFGRAVQFAVMLSPWHLVIEKVPEKDVKFAQLLQSTVTSFVDLKDSLARWRRRLDAQRRFEWTLRYCMHGYRSATTGCDVFRMFS